MESPRLLDQVRELIRFLHYSLRTDESYVYWVRLFVRFHRLRHPAEMGDAEVEAFLSWLTNSRKVSPSTHKQALSALIFLYGKVLGTDLQWMSEIGRPKAVRRPSVMLSPDEISRIFAFIEGEHCLLARLLYGTGMHINKVPPLRTNAGARHRFAIYC